MTESKVRTIGGCPGCRKSAVLKDGACAACAGKFGPEYGPMASRIRGDEAFRRLCYGALSTDQARASFIATFGDPGPPAIGRPRTYGGPT